MKKCDYGCGKEAKHQFKNDKWCCEKDFHRCTAYREKMSESHKGKILSKEHKEKIGLANKNPSEKTRKKKSEAQKGKTKSKETRKKISKALKGRKGPMAGRNQSEKAKEKMREALKFTLIDYKEKYPFLLQVEELREDPKTKEIQGHCKYNKCEKSKENNGWFNITAIQICHRINAIYNPRGFGESNFYCSDECKNSCSIFRKSPTQLIKEDEIKAGYIKEIEKPYTEAERQTLNQFILDRDNGICQFCGDPATDIHHERPVKLEPFFALDPDFAWSCCEKCHYEKGHRKGTECSTGNLANKICS